MIWVNFTVLFYVNKKSAKKYYYKLIIYDVEKVG